MYPYYELSRSTNTYSFNMFMTKNMSFPPHLHASVEVIYIISGELTITINDKIKNLQPGDLAVSFPNDIHSYNTETESNSLIMIFTPEIINSYFSARMDKTLENPFLSKDTIGKDIVQLMDMLFTEYKTTKNEYVIKGLLYSIFGKLNDHFHLKHSKYQYNNTMQNLLRYIESNYCENISLQSIADALGYSKFYLSRIFSNKIGYQFNDYVNRLRLNKAQKLLISTSMTISTIAMECGFESLRNFNRVFKDYKELTPTEFRKLKVK
jgi:YesN/AraC family two-component response regulator